MSNRILSYLAMLPAFLLLMLFIVKTLKLKRPFLFILINFVISYSGRILSDNVYFPILFVAYIFSVALPVVFVEKKDRVWALVVSFAYTFSNFFAELAVVALAYYVIEPMGLATLEYMMTDPTGYATMSGVASIACVPFLFLSRAILRRQRMRQINFKIAMLYLLIVVGQTLLISLIVIIVNGEGSPELIPSLIPLAVVLPLVADFGFFFGMSRQRQANLLKAQVEQAENYLELQGEYYEKLQANILMINQIRHDITNQLRTAYYLLSNGDTEETKQLLDRLRAYTNEQVGPRFCSNLVVDAVLSEKAVECEAKGIRLQVMSDLPPKLFISNAHLCSAYSNILDNAIAAAESCTEEKFIALDTGMSSGYLVIRCCNSSSVSDAAVPLASDPGSGNLLRLHGLGIGILKTLARIYDGNLNTESDGGRFTVTLLLRSSEKTAAGSREAMRP